MNQNRWQNITSASKEISDNFQENGEAFVKMFAQFGNVTARFYLLIGVIFMTLIRVWLYATIAVITVLLMWGASYLINTFGISTIATAAIVIATITGIVATFKHEYRKPSSKKSNVTIARPQTRRPANVSRPSYKQQLKK